MPAGPAAWLLFSLLFATESRVIAASSSTLRGPCASKSNNFSRLPCDRALPTRASWACTSCLKLSVDIATLASYYSTTKLSICIIPDRPDQARSKWTRNEHDIQRMDVWPRAAPVAAPAPGASRRRGHRPHRRRSSLSCPGRHDSFSVNPTHDAKGERHREDPIHPE